MGRQYDHEFKRQAVLLSDEIGLAPAANQLGVPYQTLSEWRKKRTREKPEETEESKRLKQLEREIRELREENEVLKDALGFFARSRKK